MKLTQMLLLLELLLLLLLLLYVYHYVHVMRREVPHALVVTYRIHSAEAAAATGAATAANPWINGSA